MDETLLHSLNLSCVYDLNKKYFKKDIPYHFAFYYFRPGLSRFINNIKILKNLNSLKYVYIFTSASNITGLYHISKMQ